MVRVSCCPPVPFEDCWLFGLEDCWLFAFEDCWLLDLLLLELPDERAVDGFERDELDRDLVAALLELPLDLLVPDLLVPFLDVELEPEVEPPARFA